MKAEDLRKEIIKFSDKYIREISATDAIKINDVATLLGSFAELEKYLEEKKK